MSEAAYQEKDHEGYRMESGEDLVKFKEKKSHAFPTDAWCLEASWEVANKQGGIYTVIRSKASVSAQEIGNKYILLGPLKPAHIHEVEIYSPAQCTALYRSTQVARNKGWNVLVGKWLIDGSPTVVLFDIGSASHNMNQWKQELYENTQIGVPHSDIECNDTIILGFMIAQFIADFNYQLTQERMCSPPGSCCRPAVANPLVVAHVHEWMAGVALIMLRMWRIEVATVFTTHATMLGRHLCAGAMDFYNYLANFNVDVEAGKRKIYHRYCLERAAASLAHVFTTVSEITGEEASYLIKRRPDFITPNGLNVKRMSHEFQNLHQIYKEKIQKFVNGHFYGHIDFNLDKTLFFFIAGRYEFGNKGGDIFVEALARLNHYLKACASDVTVITFIIFPTKNTSFNVDSLKGHAITKSLQEIIGNIQTKVGSRMYDLCSRGITPDPNELLQSDDLVKLKRCILASQRSDWPPITTHNVSNPDEDPVLRALNRCHLLNSPSDRVKVVFHPDFLNSDNPLLGLSYEEFIRGCHLGCFPSYYEPWGYTPAECTIMGIPSITSNLSGFGCFIQEHVSDPQSYGIFVLDRKFISVEESVRNLAQCMFDFTQLTRKQRIIQRNRTERLSDLLDWKRLHKYYSQARVAALSATYPDYVPDCITGSACSTYARFPKPCSSFTSSVVRAQLEPDISIDLDAEDSTDILDQLDIELPGSACKT